MGKDNLDFFQKRYIILSSDGPGLIVIYYYGTISFQIRNGKSDESCSEELVKIIYSNNTRRLVQRWLMTQFLNIHGSF